MNRCLVHGLWRFLIRPGGHYPQTSESWRLNVTPDHSIDLDRLAEVLRTTSADLRKLTLTPVLQGITAAELSPEQLGRHKLEAGAMLKYQRYCPRCVAENHSYALLWNISGLEHCHLHGTRLLDTCHQCGKRLPYLGPASQIGRCSHCWADLTTAPVVPGAAGDNEKEAMADWRFKHWANRKGSCRAVRG